MSGSVSESTTLTSISRVAPFRIELGAADEDLDAGDVLLWTACGGRHQLSSDGSESELPRRRCSGLSTPLASAISRHFVASPYAP